MELNVSEEITFRWQKQSSLSDINMVKNYLKRLKKKKEKGTSVDNTLLDKQNSSYPTQPHPIIALLFIQNNSKFKKLCVWF